MSKVFSAKRKFIEFTYKFMDGTEAQFRYCELPQSDIEQLIDNENKMSLKEQMKYRIDLFKKQVVGDIVLIDKMIAEQYNYGNIYDMIAELDEMLNNERKKK